MTTPEGGACTASETDRTGRIFGLVSPEKFAQYIRPPWPEEYKQRFDRISGAEGDQCLTVDGHAVRFRTYIETDSTVVRSVELLDGIQGTGRYVSYATCAIEAPEIGMCFERHGAQIQIENGYGTVLIEPEVGSDDIHTWEDTDSEYVDRLIVLAEAALPQAA